jgi:hypothetical protein
MQSMMMLMGLVMFLVSSRVEQLEMRRQSRGFYPRRSATANATLWERWLIAISISVWGCLVSPKSSNHNTSSSLYKIDKPQTCPFQGAW